jgi:ribosomal protein S18 acetylase RimI-like enzyme
LPDRVPVLRIPYLAVAEKHQGNGYGTEMFLQLQEMLAAASGAPRFMYLECWEDNVDAVRFYKEIGFEQYDIEAIDKVPYDETPGNLLRLAYDRFRLP